MAVKREIESGLMVQDFLGTRIMDWDEILMDDPDDPNEIQYRNALYPILSKLEDVVFELDYLAKPVRDSGRLIRNQRERYELNGYEFTSGASIEILIVDPEGLEPDYWVHTTVEHDGTDYHAAFNHISLDGVMARIRE